MDAVKCEVWAEEGEGPGDADVSEQQLLFLFTLSQPGLFWTHKNLDMPLKPSLVFRICTRSIRSLDFKVFHDPHLLLGDGSEDLPVPHKN